MRRFFLAVFLIGCGQISLSQSRHFLTDTVLLEEVVSVGELKKYQPGAKISTLPALQAEISQTGGIENAIRRFTPVYIKSDAGGLSTIHIRGTSASHTTINFGGININSLTLGQSNLSSVPLFLFDGMSLQYGSSSTINGSGAIGGAVYLSLSDDWTDGFRISAKTTAGSFGEFMTGVKVYTGNGKWESVTRGYFFQKENDFPFKNSYTGEFNQDDYLNDIQHGASLRNAGFLQELNYRFSKNEFFRSSIWYSDNWYQVQPNMQTNWHYTGTQEIAENNLRFWSEYNNKQHLVEWKAGAGYVHDMQVYNHNATQQIGTNRLIGELEAVSPIIKGIQIKTGALYQYINPDVYTYSDSVIDYEQHLDLYVSSVFEMIENLKFSVNLRQMFVTNFEAPFTPSLGTEYLLRIKGSSYLKLASSLSRSYRIPTFNDRYWGVQGNPHLKPESGKNAEAGITFMTCGNLFNTSLGINVFYMDIENWIEWRNFGEWQAQNVLEVVSKGVEFQSVAEFTTGALKTGLTLNYSFNPVEPVKNEEQNGLVNRQMNYIPKHVANAALNSEIKNWHFLVDGQFTGERFTDDFGHTIDGFFVLNCGVIRDLQVKNQFFSLNFLINNLLNADYQNQKYYAMPGRSFQLGLKYDFKSNK